MTDDEWMELWRRDDMRRSKARVALWLMVAIVGLVALVDLLG